jgi:phosphohistidine swiveling domain-containing protein
MSIIWTQFGNATADKFGGKAKNLAELIKAGFKVPTAVGISTDAFNTFQKTGQIDSQLVLELERIRSYLGGKIALRSSATCEDGRDLSMAGVFETFYLQSPDQTIADALKAIYLQAQSEEVRDYLGLHQNEESGVEMAVILQRLIEPDISGVIYTDVNGEDILIQYTTGFGNQIVDGITEGSSLIYSSEQARIAKSKNTDLINLPAGEIKSLSDLAIRIKQTFANLPQDIEFAIENGHVYILQARTLTTEVHGIDLEMSREDIVHHTQEQVRQIVRQEKQDLDSDAVILSDSNFSELLPRPKEMDFGVFAYIFTGSDSIPGAIQLGRQEMGYPLENESVGFMHYLGGKPYFSIARDAHTFYAGFPETKEEYNQTLVAEYLTQIENDPEKGEYPEMGLYLQDPTLDDLTCRYGEQKGQEYFKTYQEFKERMANHAETFLTEYLEEGKPQTDQFIHAKEAVELQTLTDDQLIDHLHSILEHMRTTSCVHFVKSARLGFYYSQRLQEMLGNYFDMNPDEVDATFASLNQGLEGSEITRANLLIAEADNFRNAMLIGQRVVGHYSTGEMLEISHPRLKDDADALQNYIEGIYGAREQYVTEFEQQKAGREQSETQLISSLDSQTDIQVEFKNVMKASQTYMALRETVKYQFVKEYSLLRDSLIEIANRSGIDEEEIFSLDPREIKDFFANPESFAALITERQERFSKYGLLNLPPVIRESDINNLGEEGEELGDTIELFGKLLAQGQALAEAIIVNIEDFETVSAAREILLFYRNQALPIVLVASQMNLSHDPLIVQADGLVIENAGLVSHGAQRARELGRGAIGGIKVKHLKTGEHVSFDPSSKKVTKMKGSE